MKIFLSFLQSEHQHNIPAYRFWEYYIKQGIQEAGFEWVETDADWARGLVPQTEKDLNAWKSTVWDKTLTFLKNHPADIFLSYLYPQQIDIQAIKEIQKLGIPCVNFFCDNVRNFRAIPKEFNVFDLNWVPEYKAVAMYKKAGLAHINLPMPMWVEEKFRTIPVNENDRLTFIGSRDIQRQLFFENVLTLKPDLPMDIYGYGWANQNDRSISKPDYTLIDRIKFQANFISEYGVAAYVRKFRQRTYSPEISDELKSHVHPALKEDDYIKLTRESQITIGINRYPSFNYPLANPNTYSRLRDIEAPMLGACYITEWTEGIGELYDIGTEIETYVNAADLIEKIEKLQADPARRNKMRSQAQKKALQENSVTKSLQTLKCLIRS